MSESFESWLPGETEPQSHRTADAAWHRVWAHASARVVRVSTKGARKPVPRPATRPYGSRSGRSGPRSPEMRITCPEADQARYQAAAAQAGTSLSAWVREACEARFSSQNTARSRKTTTHSK